jgi:FlaA1/EpsC-like NDP-sugar epimerase
MSPSVRFLILFGLYSLIAVLSYWLSWRLRFGFYPGLDGIPENFADKVLWQGVVIIAFKMLCLYVLGQFTGLLRFFRIPDAVRLFIASSLATFVFLVVWVASSYAFVPPASVILVDFILFTFAVMGLRVGIRILDERRKGFFRRGVKPDRIAIVGAGQAGSALLTELASQPELGMRAVVFFDDKESLHGRQLHGVPIVGAPEEIPSYHLTNDLDKVILAIPRADTERVRSLVSLLKRNRIPVETIPSVEDLMNGKFRASLTREINIEDLLYRDAVQQNTDELREFVTGRVVLVTGAGGSIGQELSLQLSNFHPKRLILVDRCESVLFLSEKLGSDKGGDVDLEVRVADVLDREAMQSIFDQFSPDLVYHAAAHKHVGMMERQPATAIINNVGGTLSLARQSVESGVRDFCLISTDKAVYPSSVMGASKRLAELALAALVCDSGSIETNFSIVRFGNVIGSSGSVIPTFEEQIDRGGPVTVTHREMTRYFMTIPEAVGLVLQATTFSAGNALYMLDMGTPVQIDAVARDLIRLKGLEPDVDIEIIYTGIRPGEKLHEVLQRGDEQSEPTSHAKIVRLVSAKPIVREANAFFQSLETVEQQLPGLNASEARNRIFDLLTKLEEVK